MCRGADRFRKPLSSSPLRAYSTLLWPGLSGLTEPFCACTLYQTYARCRAPALSIVWWQSRRRSLRPRSLVVVVVRRRRFERLDGPERSRWLWQQSLRDAIGLSASAFVDRHLIFLFSVVCSFSFPLPFIPRSRLSCSTVNYHCLCLASSVTSRAINSS